MRRLYFSLGKNKFWEYVLLALFLLFFYGPLMNMLLLSFAGDYEYPDVIPRSYGFKWWDYVLSKAQLVQSIGTSLVLAVVVTLLSLAVCLPAAYALARYPFRGRSAVRLSFLLTNAFPKMGIYTAMAVIFYKAEPYRHICRSGAGAHRKHDDVHGVDSFRRVPHRTYPAGGKRP